MQDLTPRSRGLVITIDGPSGTGKSTAARLLARHLGYLYLDTGAMYRAVALKALQAGASLDDPRQLTRIAERSRVTFSIGSRQARVLLDGADVTRAIRGPTVSDAASVAATVPGVRRALVRQQQAIGARGGIVAEGRDTGTVVFPEADLKVFLTASPKERARRRYEELKSAGHPVSFAQVFQDIRSRDRRDRRRAASPLRRARRAVLINNSRLKSRQVFDRLSDYVRGIIRCRGGCLD